MREGNTEQAVRLSGVRAVVFDLDDTLYSERAFALSGFTAVGLWLQEKMTCPIDPAARMRELFDSGDRQRIFDRLLAEVATITNSAPREPTAQRVAEMVEVYRSHTPTIGLYPDAEAALCRWRKDFRLGLVSDGLRAVQQRKIDALGLSGRLQPIILTDQWDPEFWKPHPRAFQEIERVWDVRGPACLYIADNPRKDFIAPRSLGWQTVRIRRPDGVYREVTAPPNGQPDVEVASLDQINL